MAITIKGRQKGKAKERPKDTQPTKKGRWLIPLVVGCYLTHGPSNVTSMQIIMGGLEEASLTNAIFLFIAKAKAC